MLSLIFRENARVNQSEGMKCALLWFYIGFSWLGLWKLIPELISVQFVTRNKAKSFSMIHIYAKCEAWVWQSGKSIFTSFIVCTVQVSINFRRQSISFELQYTQFYWSIKRITDWFYITKIPWVYYDSHVIVVSHQFGMDLIFVIWLPYRIRSNEQKSDFVPFDEVDHKIGGERNNKSRIALAKFIYLNTSFTVLTSDKIRYGILWLLYFISYFFFSKTFALAHSTRTFLFLSAAFFPLY